MTTAASSNLLTLVDWTRRMDPNGYVSDIVETLAKLTPVIQDAVFKPSNLPTGHRFTSRTALPAVSRRQFNQGVAPTKSQTGQVTESMTMLEGNSVVDVDEADLNGDTAAFRASEDTAFVQSMTQQAEAELLYGNAAADPTDMTGLVPRFGALSGQTGKQIINFNTGATQNNNATLALVGWGDRSVYGIFPKGTKAGLTNRDMGRQLWDPANNGAKFLAWVTNWNWKMGLCVQDYRFVSMIRNIDVTALATTGNLLMQSAIQAYYRIFAPESVRLAWYCNRTIAEYLHLQALDSTKQSTLRIDAPAGQPIVSLLGFPVRRSDAMPITEAIVS